MTATDSFHQLTPERVLESVEIGGRRATGRVLALNSLENRVYDVELEDGERVVTKFYRPGRWSREAILEEHALLAELAEAEVPAVAPMDLGDGLTLRESPVDGGVLYYAVWPKVRGRVPDELTSDELDQIGRLVARLHHVGARRPAPARPRLDAATYGDESVRIIVEAQVVPDELARRYEDVARAIVDRCRRALEGAPAIRLHGDCHLGNLLQGSGGFFFVDFDDFLSGPPVQDLWLAAPAPDEDGANMRARIARAYAELRDFDFASLAWVEPLRALRILRYAAWIAKRWHDPAFQRAFPGFDERPWWQRELQQLDEQLYRLSRL